MKDKKIKITQFIPEICYLVLGILLVIYPEILDTACRVIGIIAIFVGVVYAIIYLTKKNINSIYTATLWIALGIFLEIIPAFLNFLIPVLIGIILVVNGFAKMQYSYSTKDFNSKWIFSFIVSIILIVLGVLIIVNQNFFMNTVKWSLGAVLIAASVVNIIANLLTISRKDS